MSTHIISEDWPETIDGLIEAVEGMFHCKQGDLGRYVFLEDESKYTDPYTYRTLMLGAIGRDDRFPRLLRFSMFHIFQELHVLAGGGFPTLYWRHPSPNHITEEQDGHMTYIRSRVAIPAISEWPIHLYKPEGDPVREVA